MSHYYNVYAMMEGFGQTEDIELGKVEMPDEDTRELRARLLLEEALEQIEALGCTVVTHGRISLPHDNLNVMVDPDKEPDMVELLDSIADVSVINEGTAIACGLDMAQRGELQAVVDMNNAQKVQNGSVREDGKFVKHPDHKAPPIESLLEYWVANFDIVNAVPLSEEWNELADKIERLYEEIYMG